MSNIITRYIEQEMKESYLDYSMSVIVSRALPDVKDGLKPVHRRILFAMNELGMTSDKPHKKSARIVGEVLGKYHPHGDSAVYNTMVRMAQDFNYRYELIDGHGNFGSIDGDSAAAMRYTEARMAKITKELLVDLDKNTIDYRKNFDDSLDEPIVLPAKLPNLLLNGATGIAVGMATNIPPHNLGELVDGILAVINNRLEIKGKKDGIVEGFEKIKELITNSTEKIDAEISFERIEKMISKAEVSDEDRLLNTIEKIKAVVDKSIEENDALNLKLQKERDAREASSEIEDYTEIPKDLSLTTFREVKEVISGILGEATRITSRDLIEYISGPDFPTGGIIDGKKGIYDAYTTGRGRVRVRGKVKIEEHKNGKSSIIINEVPFQVNKARMIEKIANLVKEKKVTGITDLRDESDRNGIRVVIETKRGEEPELILNKLYKYTELQNTFGIIMLALVDNVPKVLKLKEILDHYINHRFDVITRRTKFELEKAEKRSHILEGFRIALDNIGEIIKIVRGSKDANMAKETLKIDYSFSEAQARSILDMKLQRLTGLERDKIENEYTALVEIIKELNFILDNEGKVYEIITEELEEIKENYSDERRTQIEESRLDINIEDLISDEKVIVTLTNKGYVKRISQDKYKAQKRGGKGVSSQNTVEGDFVENMYAASNLDTMMIYTDSGKVYSLKVYEIPEFSKQARGKLIENMINLGEDEKVRSIIKVRDFSEEHEVFFLTRNGIVKKTNLSQFKNINKSGLRAINLKDGDDLIFVGLVDTKESEVFVATRLGYSIKFPQDNVRSMGRSATGVKGITLRPEDEVVSGVIVEREDAKILTITENGYGKRTRISGYTSQSRGGKGVINIRVSARNGKVVDVKSVTDDEELLAITSNGVVIRTPVEDISLIGRATQGVKIMRVEDTEHVVSTIKVKRNLEELIEEELLEITEEKK
ncbi:DNA gyrase subunit A [Psychrilyobacter atlanticus]|uniref:DNA gyrase subunit A n=1 Tax=Psychrilyobacter atlanticus TaxID=271091 RepID=UPI0003FC30DB|nr:DNA gyrase subunit A [Psychrilyobacter atlanticus]